MLQTLKQLYSETRRPGILPGTNNTRIAGIMLAADLILSFSLFSIGYSIALSHISGFIIAGSLLLLLHLFDIDKSSANISGNTSFQKTLSIIIYSLVQLAIRAGSIASLTHFGLSETAALLIGILTATLIGSYSSGLLLNLPNRNSSLLNLSIALAICVFTLRLVFLGGMEVIPQEAYYWNYAQHLSTGYLDHPPLVATTIYTGETLFGHNAFGTRFGAFIYGLLFIVIFYRYARLQVDQTCAIFATTFALLLPYFFMGTGFLMSPESPLALAWVMALYFFYHALVNGKVHAWYGVGIAMGLGMLSKYSIVLLVPAALIFILIDTQARTQLLRKEPYIAALITTLFFSPVIYWNASNDWASFAFHASDRFEKISTFSLGVMLTNILAIVTPLPLLALPYLFSKKIVNENTSIQSPFTPRVRLFIGIFLLVPMSIFAWSALENEPRYNWTGPLWISLLPMLAWLTINAGNLRWHWIGLLLKKLTIPLLFVLLGFYAVLLHFISIGLPGAPFPSGTARLLGWPEVSHNILDIQQKLPADDSRIIIVGMDKYFIASKLSYYGTEKFLGKGNQLQVTGNHLIGGNSLMFNYWDSATEFEGDTIIMLSRSKSELSNHQLKPFFEKLSPEIKTFPLYKNDFNLPEKTIRNYYYRVGFGYQPPKLTNVRQ